MEEREWEEGLRGSRRGELVIRRSGEIAIRDRDACGRLDLEEVGAGPYLPLQRGFLGYVRGDV